MSIQQMNVHDCVRCGNPINYDDTDWCDVCDMSIFDDRMVKTKKMLTIQNFKSELLNSWWGGWKITDVLDDVHYIDEHLNIIGPTHYSVTFIYYRVTVNGNSTPIGPHGSNRGKLLLTRETDEFLKGQYRYELWLNQKMFNSGGVTPNALRDKKKFIESVVSTLDYQLYNPC
jgi:hypothetical protein